MYIVDWAKSWHVSYEGKAATVHLAGGHAEYDTREDDDRANDQEDNGCYLHDVGQVGAAPVQHGIQIVLV